MCQSQPHTKKVKSEPKNKPKNIQKQPKYPLTNQFKLLPNSKERWASRHPIAALSIVSKPKVFWFLYQ
jgi:hypothetical protein